MSDFKTSLLVEKQLPEFIREDHPNFVLFLEAYYEFLDNTSYGKAKDYRNLYDVDQTLSDFQTNFYNSFLPYIPKNTSLNKETLIKNILPIFLSKGSENSYKLLFRMLFGNDISINYPGKQVLRASSGKWVKDNVLRIETTIYSEYISDGEQLVYNLPYQIDESNIRVVVNGVVSTDYYIRKEYRKLIFNSSPLQSDIIRIYYDNFNISVFNDRKITGLLSDASAIIENTGKFNSGGASYYQLFINTKTLIGEFLNGEIVKTDIIIDDITIPFTLQSYFDIENIYIINGGSGYNSGDPVIISGIALKPAIAFVDEIYSDLITDLNIINGGSGYLIDDIILANTYSNTFFQSHIQTVDDSGLYSSNSITYNTDFISDYLNVNINAIDYGFPAANTENVNTIIIDALSNITLSNLGEVTSISVDTSQLLSNVVTDFIVYPSILYNNIRTSDLGIIGKLNIINGGIDYEIGDQILFINVDEFSGQGASAIVANVASNGSINQIHITDGGLSYKYSNLPYVQVISSNGSNAIINVEEIIGMGALLESDVYEGVVGEIISIKVAYPGSGYATFPLIDLSQSGNGNAVAMANVRSSFISLPGRWTSSDGIISNEEIKLQGRDYYIDYSYVINSQVEFEKYKSILKDILHPAGFVEYANYIINDIIDINITANIDSTITLASI